MWKNEYNQMDMRAKGLFLWQEVKYLEISQIFKNKGKLIFKKFLAEETAKKKKMNVFAPGENYGKE